MSGCALLALVFALYLQHIKNYQPCVLCVYIRLAFLCTFLTTLFISMKIKFLNPLFHLGLWASLLIGGKLSFELYQLQNNPSPFATCDFLPSFWIPLEKWFPFLFQPQGNCTDEIVQIWGVSMAEWGIVIFSIYALFTLGAYTIKKYKS